MRISTQSFFEQSKVSMGAQQETLFRVQQKLGAGTRFLAPSDDPVAATRALGVSQSLAESAQYAGSRARATLALSHEESALQNVTSILQDIKTLTVQAGNGTLTDADRAAIATTLQSHFDQLLGVANSDDGNGQFLFAGFKSATAPFLKQPGGSVQYAGDQGQRLMQVDVARQMASGDDGRSVFQSVQPGARYVTSGASANSGTGVFGTLGVVDATDANFGKDFVITFSGGNYQVDTTDVPPVSVVAPTPFTPGATLSFGGLQMRIDGAPADGDSFQVSTARNAGTDIFGTIADLVAALRTPLASGGPSAQAALNNALNTAHVKIDNAHDNVLTVRASVGSRLAELDALGSAAGARELIDKSYRSELQDLDYASALSEFSQREVALKATQQTFARLHSIALFNFL